MTAAILILEPLPGQSTLPPDVPDRYNLTEQRENRLGRNPDCGVFLDYDPFQMVSRYHAAIQAFPAIRGRPQRVWQLRDLGSANGTYVNGQRLEESHWLQAGDRIQLGMTGPCFRFELRSGRSSGDRSGVDRSDLNLASPNSASLDPASPNSAIPNSAHLDPASPNSAHLDPASPNSAIPNSAHLDPADPDPAAFNSPRSHAALGPSLLQTPEPVSQFPSPPTAEPAPAPANSVTDSPPPSRSLAPNSAPARSAPTSTVTSTANPANPAAPPSAPNLTLSQLFPLASPGSNFFQKALLVPGILTVALVVSLFAAFGHPLTFNRILAFYLGFAGYYFFIYRLCGKPKPGWVLGLVAIAMALILQSPLTSFSLWLFREVLPGALPEAGQGLGPLQQFGRLFIGTGLLEEGLKAVPVLLCWAIGRHLSSPWRERVGLWEPLDGILLGAASGVGFTLVETLGQYVPQVTAQISELNGLEAGQLAGLQLMIPRLLGSIAGHMAYSGYFGYFLGLSILQPRQRWQILLVGYLSAAFLHTLWNWAGLASTLLLTVAGLLSYFVLMGAILKARSLSPTRAHNFATNLYPAATPPKR